MICSFDGVAHAVFLRSPHAHARVASVDAAASKRARGVLAVLTATDVAADGLKPLRPTVEANVQTNGTVPLSPATAAGQDASATSANRSPWLIAETRNQALDAAEHIVIDYEPLPAVISASTRQAPDAPLLTGDVPGNICLDWHWGQTTEVADAL